MAPKVIKPAKADPTANSLMVGSATSFTNEEWDRKRISDKLVGELGVRAETAEQIAQAVEERIIKGGLDTVTTTEIRTLVQAELLARGLRAKYKKGNLAAMSYYDLETLMTSGNKENSNVPHNPEAINLYIGENIVKQFALNSGKVFSDEVATAHKDGYIHLHDLGLVCRPYCSGQSPAYVARFGLSARSYTNPSKPAKHLLVLINHIKEFSSLLQGHFAGAIGWDAVNIFLAPYVNGMSDDQVKQAAQDLIFSFSQLLGTRGGQAIFSDLNFYLEVPQRYRDTFAICAGGKFAHKWIDKYGEAHIELVSDLPKNPQMFKQNMKDGFLTYEDFATESRRFLKACLEVYRDGDANGLPFFFPKANVHITKEFWRTTNFEGYLELISEAVAKTGSVYLIFERGDTNSVSQCCRLRVNMTDDEVNIARHEPWKMRFCALQNITLNMPRLAMEVAAATPELPKRMALYKERLNKYTSLAMEAHIQKKKFITKLLDLGDHGPLAALAHAQDGAPYLNVATARYLIGILGLNEAVQALTEQQLHESDLAMSVGLEIIAYLYLLCQKLSKEHRMNIALEQTPAESTAYRFARLDLEKYPEARKLVKGDPKKGAVYYTNSTHLAADAPVSLVERVYAEGLFHGAIDAGSITHAWMGEATPDVKSVAGFIKKIYDFSQSDQVVFSPTFTRCNACQTVVKGEHVKCKCGSSDVTYVTRVTGYYGEIQRWNAGKQQEHCDRKQHNDKSLSCLPAHTPSQKKVILFGKPNCSVCHDTKEKIEELQKNLKFDLDYVEIDTANVDEASKQFALLLKHNLRDVPALLIGHRRWSAKMPTTATIEHAIREQLYGECVPNLQS